MSYNIPRNVKGEGRILYIFSYKAIAYTGVGILIGVAFNFIFSLVGLDVIGYIFMGVFGFIGFAIATFKMPDLPFLKDARLAAGEQIAIKFKRNKNKFYVYTEEVTKEDTKEIEGGKNNGK